MHVWFMSHVLEFRKYSVKKQNSVIKEVLEMFQSVFLQSSRLTFLTASWTAIPRSTTITSNYSKANLIIPLPAKPWVLCLSSHCDPIPPITEVLKLRTLLGLLSYTPSIKPELSLWSRLPDFGSKLYHLVL